MCYEIPRNERAILRFCHSSCRVRWGDRGQVARERQQLSKSAQSDDKVSRLFHVVKALRTALITGGGTVFVCHAKPLNHRQNRNEVSKYQDWFRLVGAGSDAARGRWGGVRLPRPANMPRGAHWEVQRRRSNKAETGNGDRARVVQRHDCQAIGNSSAKIVHMLVKITEPSGTTAPGSLPAN